MKDKIHTKNVLKCLKREEFLEKDFVADNV